MGKGGQIHHGSLRDLRARELEQLERQRNAAVLPGGAIIKSRLYRKESERCDNCGAPTYQGNVCTYCGA